MEDDDDDDDDDDSKSSFEPPRNWAAIFLASDCLTKEGRADADARRSQKAERVSASLFRGGGRGHAVALAPSSSSLLLCPPFRTPFLRRDGGDTAKKFGNSAEKPSLKPRTLLLRNAQVYVLRLLR